MGIKIKKYGSVISLIVLLCLVAFFIKAYFDGSFNSKESLQAYISNFGFLAPLALTLSQTAQAVVPVLPGFLGSIVGAILFGWLGGFLCNYIGISLGSIIAFLLARIFGKSIIEGLFSKQKYDKWTAWIEKKKYYSAILFLIMILPLFPDDFFCYIAGLTKMKTRNFIWVVLLGKPWCLLLYSIIFS